MEKSVLGLWLQVELRCGHVLQVSVHLKLTAPVQLCSKNVDVLVIRYFLPFCSWLKHVKAIQNACRLLWFLKMQSGALALSGSSLSCRVIHRRTDPLWPTACCIQLLILIVLREIPHARLFILRTSFMSLCEDAGAGDNGAGYSLTKLFSFGSFYSQRRKI